MTKESPSFDDMEKALFAVRDQQGKDQAVRIVKSFGYERAIHIQAKDYGRVVDTCSKQLANPQMLIHGLFDEEIGTLLLAMQCYVEAATRGGDSVVPHTDNLIEKLKYTLGH